MVVKLHNKQNNNFSFKEVQYKQKKHFGDKLHHY